jgi:ribonuclease-3
MDESLLALQDRLEYSFADPSWLRRAVTHASAGPELMPSNERLEFLGDAVIGLVVSEHLFRVLPDSSEGDMTIVKSGVVSRASLAEAGKSLGLAGHLLVDEGLKQRGKYPPSMLSDAFEAIVGAIFIDGGIEPARDFILRMLGPRVEKVRARRHALSYKSLLQHKTQAQGKGVPRYTILQSTGPDHKRSFQAAARVEGQECGTGWGPTKKDAERNAARSALDLLYPGWQTADEEL